MTFDLDVPTTYLMPNEPDRFQSGDWQRVLGWAVESGAQDVTIQHAECIVFEINGRLLRVTRHALTTQEVMDLAVGMTRNNRLPTEMEQAKDYDDVVVLPISRTQKPRFRFNATRHEADGRPGISITLRSIPGIPPTLDELDLPAAVRANLVHDKGIVLVVGETGSGKSTLLASVIRSLLEEPQGHRKILTYEWPIEYVYDDVAKPTSIIAQTPIPTGLPDFRSGARNALRRHPRVIMIGELRDAETMAAAMLAADSGHLTYGTVHANGVTETIQRMVNEFPEGERAARALALINNLRLIVCQTLVPNIVPTRRRVALREWLVFSEDIRVTLIGDNLDPRDLVPRMRQVMAAHGHSFQDDALLAHRAGRIDDIQLRAKMAGHRLPPALPTPGPGIGLTDIPETRPLAASDAILRHAGTA